MNKLLRTSLAPRRNRRGITLLFVLSLIVLFLLMGTSFMLIANQFRRSAVVTGNIKVRRDDARSLVSRAFYDVYRGVSLDDTTSPLRGHSILEDMYGYGLLGNVDVLNQVPGTQQIYRLTLQPNVRRTLDNSPVTLSTADHQYAGHLITFTSGESVGTTCQVLAYDGANQAFFLRPTWRDNSELAPFLLRAVTGDSIVMNGRPFVGFGAGGFNPGAAANEPALGPQALLPNRIGESRTQFRDNYLRQAALGSSQGNYDYRSVNEDYDAPDYQNMFLAGWDANGAFIPSFFRQSLHTYHGSPTGPHRSLFDAFTTTPGTLDVDNIGDGNNDGIWIDIGLPLQTDVKGRVYRPLVSYTILDLDANVNLNFHGNPTQLDPNLFVSTRDLFAGGFGSPPGRTGRGHGVGEISLDPLGAAIGNPLLANNIMRGNAVWPGRYGYTPTDSVPGIVGLRDDPTGQKFAAIPSPGNLVGNAYATAADLQGRFNLGVSANSPALFGVPLGMPVVDILASPLVEGVDIAYEADISSSPYTPVFTGTVKDVHFSAKELEGVLRHDAPDGPTLPQRLVDLIGTGSLDEARFWITTDSFEVPTAPQHLVDDLNRRLVNAGITNLADRNYLINHYLPPELRRGGKLNLNRSFDTYAGSGIDQRIELARHLYILLLLLCEDRFLAIPDYNRDGSSNYLDRRAFCHDMAQWAVNIVDFRDPDPIMTGFKFDYEPWNGWFEYTVGPAPWNFQNDLTTPIGIDPLTGQLYGGVVWGCERPELLITESYAHHDRRTEDTAENGTVADGDPDYDSALVPNAAAFFELYAPWTYSTSAAATANNEVPNSLYDLSNNLALSRTAPNGDPVWRMVATRKTIPRFYDLDDPFITRAAGNGDLERIVYFIQPAGTGPEYQGPKVYYPDTPAPSLPRGGFAVVGSAGIADADPGSGVPEYRTYLGRRAVANPLDPAELEQTRRICLQPTANLVKVWNWDGASLVEESRNCIAIPIGMNNLATGPVPRSLGLSDPVQGYAVPGVRELLPIGDGYRFVDSSNTAITLDTPIDKTLQSPGDWELFLRYTGTVTGAISVPGFRAIHLQRLANPDLPYDPNTNPYLTVDVHAVDLLSFNGTETPGSGDPDELVIDIECTSFERGEGPLAAPMVLWREDVDGAMADIDPTRTPVMADFHHFPHNLADSLGTLNDRYRDDFTNAGGGISFPWLTWNNRPYESQLELASVPMFRSSLMLCKFTVNEARNRYAPPSAEDPTNGRLWFASNFGHLPNFYGDSPTVADNFPSLNLHRFLDYVEVPSRFVGVETYSDSGFFNNPAGYRLGLNYPHNEISNMRYPGKINLNTIRERTYDALMGGYFAELLWDDFASSRSGTTPGLPTDFPWVYRSAEAANYVPPAGPTGDSLLYARGGVRGVTSGPTLFRALETPAGDQPLFDVTSLSGLAKDSSRSQYFENEMRQRLGNMVTTRSSVFAVWITVGFFEVDQVTGATTRVEMQNELFQSQRYRGFYIIDRSIPVACEPGKDHNVDRAVLAESIWEEVGNF